jgi:DNA invertase Pin-like site-specific DNA recombinase
MKGAARKAIGIVRVSQMAGRDEASVPDQRRSIRAACKRDRLRLVKVHEELDVSGGTPLERRPGLRFAVEAVEAGKADVVVAAHLDRLVRSLEVQRELVDRVEAAGGQVLAVDTGQVTNGNASQWLSGTMLGAVSEYQRRTAKERSAEGQARAVADGIAPWEATPPGYTREPKRPYVPDERAPVVLEAFRRRADGATIAEVRAFLAEHGIERSYHGVQHLLTSRVYLGEIHFGELVNLEAHPPIVPRELWQRVQRVHSTRGRRPRSDRLLARLGVLRCAGCGGRMVVGTQTQNGRNYPLYRCGRVREDCDQRVTISAELVEGLVVDAVKRRLADVEGRSSTEEAVLEARRAFERTEEELAGAIRILSGFEDEAGARERLAELRQTRDRALEEVDRLGGASAAVTIDAATDWDRLSLSERRDLVRLVVDRVTVVPGKGPDRVTIKLLGE